MDEQILEMYFKKNMKQIEISKLLNISKGEVSKTLNKDSRFKLEKEERKKRNKIKHNREIQKRVENKRKEKNSSDFQILKIMHEQASMELSGGKRPMSNRAFRDWNSSIYKYNNKNRSYELKKGITAGADVPKRINWE